MFCSNFIMLAVAVIGLLSQWTDADPLVKSVALSNSDPAAASLNSSTAPNLHDNYKAWAQFCNDEECSEGCGMWVDLENPGCLNEAGRKSFRTKTNGPYIDVGLVYSPAASCPCQSRCERVFDRQTSTCHILESSLADSTFSYRFIDANDDLHVCYDANNCHDASGSIFDEPRTVGPAVPDADNVVDPATQDPSGGLTEEDWPPAGPNTGLSAWARFCDDTDCTVNCGEWVDLSNPGCLHEEWGRGSIRAKHNGLAPIAGVVYSPDGACGCQTECDDFAQDGCWVLNQTRAAGTGSYRFINAGAFGSCDNSKNDCH